MPVPVGGVSPDLGNYLQALEARIAALETPQGFTPAYLTTSAKLTTISAAQSGARWAILTDLHTAAYSDSVHWYRFDTGAKIA